MRVPRGVNSRGFLGMMLGLSVALRVIREDETHSPFGCRGCKLAWCLQLRLWRARLQPWPLLGRLWLIPCIVGNNEIEVLRLCRGGRLLTSCALCFRLDALGQFLDILNTTINILPEPLIGIGSRPSRDTSPADEGLASIG